MKPAHALTVIVAGAALIALMLFLAPAAHAVTIDYDATVAPDALTPDAMSFVHFEGTTWSTAYGEFTLNTVLGHYGIWFGNGNHTGTYNVPWQVGTNADGNYLKMRARLSSGADTWSMYLLDRTYTAGFVLYEDSLSISTPTGMSMAFDPTEYHTFEFLLKDGQVTYRLDESQVLYSGPANPASFGTGIFVIGDGSASDISGVGSMIIDHVVYTSSPAFTIPEPASLVLLTAVPLLLRRRSSGRQRKAAHPWPAGTR